jgi:predicted O-methyltransferase YrrM
MLSFDGEGKTMSADAAGMSLDVLRHCHKEAGQVIEPERQYYGYAGDALIDQARSFLRNGSVVFRGIIDNPGDWRNTEFMYDAIPATALDSDLLTLGAARAIFSRLPTVCRVLADTAYTFLSDGQEQVRVLNLGSGPGRDTLWLARRFPKRVLVTCVDKDPEAVQLARVGARNAGLDGTYECVEGNIMAFDPACPFNIAVLVGVLCPLSDAECAVLLRRIRRYLAVGGVVVATNVTPNMLASDPFGDFLIRNFARWHLRYKTREQLERILAKTRLQPIAFQTEDLQFHWVFTARKEEP